MRPAMDRICVGVALPVRSALLAMLASALLGGFSGVVTKGVTRNSFTKALSASYVLDVWGQNRDALEAAVRSKAASAYQVEVVRLTTRAAAVNDFLIYVANYQRAKVARDSTGDAERILGVIRERKGVGTAADLDVAQQKSLLEIQRATIPPLVQAAEDARIALALLPTSMSPARPCCRPSP